MCLWLGCCMLVLCSGLVCLFFLCFWWFLLAFCYVLLIFDVGKVVFMCFYMNRWLWGYGFWQIQYFGLVFEWFLLNLIIKYIALNLKIMDFYALFIVIYNLFVWWIKGMFKEFYIIFDGLFFLFFNKNNALMLFWRKKYLQKLLRFWLMAQRNRFCAINNFNFFIFKIFKNLL